MDQITCESVKLSDFKDFKSVHQYFTEAHDGWRGHQILHPYFPKDYPQSAEETRDFWWDISELFPNYSETAYLWQKGLEEHEKWIENKANRSTEEIVPGSAQVELLVETCKILNNEIDIDFNNDFLKINGANTNIRSDYLKCAYVGLYGITGHEETIKFLAERLANKLKPLFGR